VKSLDEFLPYVLTDVPGCSDEVALSAIISAAIEFCERSMVLQTTHDPVNIVANRTDYDLEPPTGMVICKVMKAWYMGRKLEPCAPDDMDDVSPYNPAVASSGSSPTHYIQKDPRTITVWRAPQSDGAKALTMRVALKPSRLAVSVDDVLFEDWADVIASGAKASLMIIPGKPFSAPQMGAINQGAFNSGINRALTRGYKGYTRANLSVRMRRL
jgi:hypothetical protein